MNSTKKSSQETIRTSVLKLWLRELWVPAIVILLHLFFTYLVPDFLNFNTIFFLGAAFGSLIATVSRWIRQYWIIDMGLVDDELRLTLINPVVASKEKSIPLTAINKVKYRKRNLLRGTAALCIHTEEEIFFYYIQKGASGTELIAKLEVEQL